jgi:transcriptional regulator GlxA family with amidase domain
MTRLSGEPVRLTFLLLPQFPMMAFAAAIEPLRSANRISECQVFEWQLASIDGKPVSASNGLQIAVHEALDRVTGADMLVVCAGLDPLQLGNAHKAHHQLRRFARHGCMVGAISSGSFILADAGLLAGRQCTVHWEYGEMFRSRYPTVMMTEDLYVVDRDVFTCSGGTAAMDLMLHFVSDACGPDLALAVAEQFIHSRIRKQEEHQRMDVHARYATDNAKVGEAIRLMESAVDEPVDMGEIARELGMSVRQIERLFRKHLCTSPKAFYLKLRLTRARALLRQTVSPIQAVAVECGFRSTSHLCHAYRRVFGLAPSGERPRPDRRTEAGILQRCEPRCPPYV